MERRNRKGKEEVVIIKNRQVHNNENSKILEALIIKRVVNVRILGNASSMAFLANWTLLYFPTQH